MGAAARTLYDSDYVEWTARMAELLREGHLEDVDLEHLAEEIKTWETASVRLLV